MKKIKSIVGILLCSMAIFLLSGNSVFAASNNEMKIHAIYLPTGEMDDGNDDASGGDATLIESNGKYLLMDCGTESSADAVVSYLKSIKSDISIDVYISHLHKDHYDAIEKIVASGITVNKIYVPYVQIDSDYRSNSQDYATIARSGIYNVAHSDGHNIEVVGLYYSENDIFKNTINDKVFVDKTQNGNKNPIKIGNAELKVIGPVYNLVNSKKLKVSDFPKNPKIGSQEGNYLNNRSLVAQIKCGNKIFFTAGDIQTEEESALEKKYGSNLKSDIYKMSHHGLSTSNSASFVKKVAPKWSYGQNSAQTGLTVADSGMTVRKTFSQRRTCSQYGFVCMVGDEKKSLVIGTKSTGVTLELGGKSLLSSSKNINKVEVKGADGSNRKNDIYFLNDKGYPYVGVKKIDGNWYYLGIGGCMEYGNYVSGKYSGYRSYGDKLRHYTEEGVMSYGFKRIDGSLFYFDANGYRMESTAEKDQFKIVSIGSKKYAMKNNGFIYTKGLVGIKNKHTWVYAYEDGALATNSLKTISGAYYYFKGDGSCMIPEDQDGNFQIVDINGKKYAMKYLYKSKFGGCAMGYIQKKKGVVTIDGTGYAYVGNKGVLKTGWNDSHYYGTKTSLRCGSPTKINKIKKVSKKGLSISWSKAKQANGYYVYRATSQKGKYKKVATVKSNDTTKYLDKKVKKGKTYYYKVVSYYKVKVGSKSKIFKGEYSAIKKKIFKSEYKRSRSRLTCSSRIQVESGCII